MNLAKRIAHLENAGNGADGAWEPWEPDAPAKLAALGLSTTPEQAAAKGFTTAAEEAAAVLGMEFGEFKAWVRAGADEYEAAHEYQWRRGRCCVRRRP